MYGYLMKVFGVALLIGGETLSVYSEMVAAKGYSHHDGSFLGIFSKNSGLIAVAGAMLIAGYIISYSAFRNIWIVSVVSVTSILIVEPGLTYFIFRQLPGRGAMIGLVFGAAGFIATLVG